MVTKIPFLTLKSKSMRSANLAPSLRVAAAAVAAGASPSPREVKKVTTALRAEITGPVADATDASEAREVVAEALELQQSEKPLAAIKVAGTTAGSSTEMMAMLEVVPAATAGSLTLIIAA